MIPHRVILAIMGFLAVANAYTMRICLSVAITKMVVKPHHNITDSLDSAVCPADDLGHEGGGDVSNLFTLNIQIHVRCPYVLFIN